MKRISSRQHPLVATFRALARGPTAGDDRLLLDGHHLVSDAVGAGLRIETAAFGSCALASDEGARLAHALSAQAADVVEVSEAVLDAMSPARTPSGIVAIAARPACSLTRVLERRPQLLLVAADVQDPGNVGAIIRAAEAGGATGVVFCGASADPFGWKALRGSMGSTLRLPVAAQLDLLETIGAIRAADIRLLATIPRGGRSPDAVDLRVPLAFLLGGEGPGLASAVIDAADDGVSIPMQHPVESLNVAVAAALLVYAAARQRPQ
ncbi:MAG TPA: RNA methyltransferase [Vicinamibacterales bacterium]|jgi:TrmH family RNA methyltransferase